MKKFIYFIGIYLVISSNTVRASFKEEEACRWYVGALAGVNQTDADTDVGGELGFCIGYKMFSSFRLEGEIVARTNQIKDMNAYFNTVVCGANLLYDIDLGFSVSPYVGFGVGSQQRSIHIKEDDFRLEFRNKKNAFAYQGICGANIPLSQKLITCLEYRCIGNDQGKELSHSMGMNFKRYF